MLGARQQQHGELPLLLRPLLLLGWLELPKPTLPENSALSCQCMHHGQGKHFGQPEITENDVPRTCALFNRISLGTHPWEGGGPAEQHPVASTLGETEIVGTSDGAGWVCWQSYALMGPPSTDPHPVQDCGTCTYWELPCYSNHQIFRYTSRLSKQSYCSQEVAQSLLKNE